MTKAREIIERYPCTASALKDDASFVIRCRDESLVRNLSGGLHIAVASIETDANGLMWVAIKLMGID